MRHCYVRYISILYNDLSIRPKVNFGGRKGYIAITYKPNDDKFLPHFRRSVVVDNYFKIDAFIVECFFCFFVFLKLLTTE